MKTLPKNLLIALCIINLQGCFLSGRYNHDWYSGPQAHKEETRRAINTVLHHILYRALAAYITIHRLGQGMDIFCPDSSIFYAVEYRKYSNSVFN